MAGHSHWAGIKHRKGRADEKRSKIFSKLSKEITVAAKLGSKDPNSNPRLRSAIQAARNAMPDPPEVHNQNYRYWSTWAQTNKI